MKGKKRRWQIEKRRVIGERRGQEKNQKERRGENRKGHDMNEISGLFQRIG